MLLYDAATSRISKVVPPFFLKERVGARATVGERSKNSKFSYVSPRSIYGETSNEGKEIASTYPVDH